MLDLSASWLKECLLFSLTNPLNGCTISCFLHYDLCRMFVIPAGALGHEGMGKKHGYDRDPFPYSPSHVSFFAAILGRFCRVIEA